MACPWSAQRAQQQTRWGKKQRTPREAEGGGGQGAWGRAPHHLVLPPPTESWSPTGATTQSWGKLQRNSKWPLHSHLASPPQYGAAAPRLWSGTPHFLKKILEDVPQQNENRIQERRKQNPRKKTTDSRSHRTNPGEQQKEIPVGQLWSWPNEQLAPIRMRHQKSLWRTSKKTVLVNPMRNTLGC